MVPFLFAFDLVFRQSPAPDRYQDVPNLTSSMSRSDIIEFIRDNNGYELGFRFPTELKDDREIVFEAVRQNGNSLQYASMSLRNDKEIVMEAIRECTQAFRFASEGLRSDLEVVTQVVNDDDIGLLAFRDHVTNSFKCCEEKMLGVIKVEEDSLVHAAKDLLNNTDFMRKAIQANPFA